MMCGRGQRMEKQAAGERDERWRERRKEKKKKTGNESDRKLLLLHRRCLWKLCVTQLES